jgi:hypothetical protein
VSVISVTREGRPLRDRLRQYRVLIDGQYVGRLPFADTADFDVQPGSHTVQIRIDWTGSPEVAVDVRENEVLALRCRPSHGPFLAILDLIGRERWVVLERVAATGADP